MIEFRLVINKKISFIGDEVEMRKRQLDEINQKIDEVERHQREFKREHDLILEKIEDDRNDKTNSLEEIKQKMDKVERELSELKAERETIVDEVEFGNYLYLQIRVLWKILTSFNMFI